MVDAHTDPDSKEILQTTDEIVARLGGSPESAIPVLQAIQEAFRYLPPEALERVAETTEITAAQLAGVFWPDRVGTAAEDGPQERNGDGNCCDE